MVRAMAPIERAAKLLAQALAVIGLGALLCFAVMTMADGMLRFFFAHPIDAVRDLGGLVAAFAVACCIPVAIVEMSLGLGISGIDTSLRLQLGWSMQPRSGDRM